MGNRLTMLAPVTDPRLERTGHYPPGIATGTKPPEKFSDGGDGDRYGCLGCLIVIVFGFGFWALVGWLVWRWFNG